VAANTRAVLDVMSNVVATSAPATMPSPDEQLLAKADPSCAIPGYTHLPGVLPSVFGGPLEVNFIGNYTTSVDALADRCSSNPRCLFFTTTGRAVGLFQHLLGGLSLADPVDEPFGMPGEGWSPNNSSTALVLPGTGRRGTAVQLRLQYRRMPLCDTRCCGTYVADGALRWQRVVAAPGKNYIADGGAPPFPATVNGDWRVDVAAMKVQCSALRRPGAELRFPFCTPACKAACCDAGLPLRPPRCYNAGNSVRYTRGCTVVRQQAYEQCTSQCEESCGFKQASRCSGGSACSPTALPALRGTWRLKKGVGRRPVRASRQYLN
jgi:hypothetical protein